MFAGFFFLILIETMLLEAAGYAPRRWEHAQATRTTTTTRGGWRGSRRWCWWRGWGALPLPFHTTPVLAHDPELSPLTKTAYSVQAPLLVIGTYRVNEAVLAPNASWEQGAPEGCWRRRGARASLASLWYWCSNDSTLPTGNAPNYSEAYSFLDFPWALKTVRSWIFRNLKNLPRIALYKIIRIT